MFTVYSDNGSDSTLVSNLFIDEYMERANDAQIKIYLYLLRMKGSGRTTSISDLADRFNHTEKDVVRSLRYWERQGLLNLRFGADADLLSVGLCSPASRAGAAAASPDSDAESRVLSFASAGGGRRQAPLLKASGEESLSRTLPDTPAAPAAVSVPDSIPGREAAAISRSSMADEAEALESFRSNADRAQLLFVIEQYVGKPLSLEEIRIIYNISENLHFSDDMIDYLLQYCIDRGNRDFHYIGRVAENWAREGIMTPAQAESSPAPVRTAAEKASGRQLSGNSRKKEETASRKSGRTPAGGRSSNSFNQFEQNRYDFDALEEELLRASE